MTLPELIQQYKDKIQHKFANEPWYSREQEDRTPRSHAGVFQRAQQTL